MTPTMRDVRLRDLLAAVEEWRRSSDEDRRYWRRRAQLAIADFRHFHLDPEAASFAAAVARTHNHEGSCAYDVASEFFLPSHTAYPDAPEAGHRRQRELPGQLSRDAPPAIRGRQPRGVGDVAAS